MGLAAIFNWFKSSNEPAKPADWTELWEILAPLSGRTGAEDFERLEDALKTEPEEKIEAAGQQLLLAIRLLDTEAHAEHLRWHPWRGPEAPFRRRAFDAALQRVIAAGPAAMERVLAEPAHLIAYDSPSPNLETQIAGCEYATPLEVIDAALGRTSDIEHLDRSWPSLDRWWDDFYVFEFQDPDCPWLTIYHPGRYTGPDGGPEEGSEAWAFLESWEQAKDAATLQVLTALSALTPQEAATPRLWNVIVSVAPHEQGTEASAHISSGVLWITRPVDETLLEAVCSTQQRTNFLVQQTAQAMLDADVEWAAAPVLEELAQLNGYEAAPF